MAVIFLESKDNAKIKHLRGLIELNSARKKHQQTVLEGTHLCLSWLQQQRKIFSFIIHAFTYYVLTIFFK